jgi:hypothetical protein
MKIYKNNITVEPLFKNYKKTIYLFIDRRLRSCTCFERKNAGLKKLSQVLSEETSDSSAFLNSTRLLTLKTFIYGGTNGMKA